ncbi:MAG: hypothetical protein NC094_02635 [Bacteroidales bacterium]|nr:hypothetical protein [Lachnoclostridium sp.]MCM1383446.1 hypothetical protein [Lachnoclostridium sp.]MCM1464295.1 hypothetical protein [Bacteroidales bacterium]
MSENAMILFREYMGDGLIVIWFLLSLGYLAVKEKRKTVRILILYVPVILLILFFNPLFADVVGKMAGDDIYYRILWLLPISPVIAYAASDIYGRLKGKARILFGITAALLIVVSGSFIYGNPFFKEAENQYHMPQAVVELCDAIEVEGREVTAVFPTELLQYVRQYSGTVCMPYGREALVEGWNYWSELYSAMEAETVDAERLAELAREEGCVYIILSQAKKMEGSLEAYDFILFGQVKEYRIYKDSLVELSVTSLY